MIKAVVFLRTVVAVSMEELGCPVPCSRHRRRCPPCPARAATQPQCSSVPPAPAPLPRKGENPVLTGGTQVTLSLLVWASCSRGGACAQGPRQGLSQAGLCPLCLWPGSFTGRTSGLQLWLGSQMRKRHWCGALLEPRAAWRVRSLLRNSPDPPGGRAPASPGAGQLLCSRAQRPLSGHGVWGSPSPTPVPSPCTLPTHSLGPGTLWNLPPGEALGAARATGRACSRWCLYSIS